MINRLFRLQKHYMADPQGGVPARIAIIERFDNRQEALASLLRFKRQPWVRYEVVEILETV